MISWLVAESIGPDNKMYSLKNILVDNRPTVHRGSHNQGDDSPVEARSFAKPPDDAREVCSFHHL